MSKKKPNINSLIEQAAEELIMLDMKDLPGMAKFTKMLSGLSEALSASKDEDNHHTCGLAAEKASLLIQNIILDESANPEIDFQTASDTVSTLQEIICHKATTAFPAELGLAPDVPTVGPVPSPGDDSAKSATQPKSTKPLIDDDLFAAFLEQQESVLPEIESEILAFEKDSNPEHLAALKRMIHTMKGEAGVCGITDIESICHKIEDYINQDLKNIALDFLFEIKDCLSDSVSAFRNGTSASCAKKIEERLSQLQKKETSNTSSKPQAKPKPEADQHSNNSILPVNITDRDLASDFVAESQEHFDAADENLLVLENDPTNQDAIGAVFRAFHTIKGVSGFIGLTPIGDLAHVAETLLDEVRKGKRSFEGNTVEVTFNALDMLKTMIADLGVALRSGNMFYPRKELPVLIKKLKDILAGAPEAAIQPLEQVSTDASNSPDTGSSSLPQQKEDTQAGPAGQQNKGSIEIKQTMKVDAEKIDLLLEMIGELVIAESIVASDPEIAALKSIRLEKNISHLTKISRQLQDTGMAMRLVPIDATFKKMARLVRDLASKCGKKIEFSMEGQDTEIDKGMVEKLGDPLVHMIRNSVDHGIESTEERIAGGKDPIGHVILRAYHKGGNVHLEIEDDGKGLDRDAIIAKAIERKLITSGDGMSDQSVFSMIFEAGFSTAKQITEVSGRGVGMDVVRRNIEALRGNVLISSTVGKGSIFTIVLPLTMAIIDGMAVKVGNETYILPVLSIVESICPTTDMISSVTGKGMVIAFRGKLIPLFRMASLFETTNAVEDPTKGIVLIIEDGGKQTGILVDHILGQQQTVIKSLGGAFGTVQGISGASIMADGHPGLIVDVSGIIKLATEN